MYNALNRIPDEHKIKELVKQGVYINDIDKIGENFLMNIISTIEPGENLKSIYLLI